MQGDGKTISAADLKLSVEKYPGYYYHIVNVDFVQEKYTVEHWKQKELFKEEYVRSDGDTEILTGFVNNDTEARAKDFSGYVAKTFEQVPVTADNKAVVEIRYDKYYSTITFNTSGRGIAPQPIKNVPGASISAPEDPTALGYIFGGWFREKECTNPYIFSTMPQENLTLYAKWTVDPSKQQDVQYVDSDGSTKPVSCVVLDADADSYAFDEGGWYAVTGNVSVNNRIENYAPENNPAHLILVDEKKLTASKGIHNPGGKGLIIYGQSIGNGTLIITNAEDHTAGIGGNANYGGGTLTINGGIVTATGGWCGAGIGGGHYGDGGKITINGGTVTATGGSDGAGIGGGFYGDGGEITINGGTLTAASTGGAGIGGGNFGSGKTLIFGINPAVLEAGPNKDNISDVDVDIYKDKHQDYGFVFINCAKASYKVEHWKQKTVRGADYQLDVTKTYTGFVNNYAEVISEKYPGYGAPKYTPEKINANGTTKIVAKYDLIYNTIIFNANGHGTAPEPIYATPGSAITAPSNPHAEGYIFEGWYTEAECKNQYVFRTMPSENKTLYAKWTPIQYTITWKDGAKVLRTDKIAYNTMPDYGPNPIKQGYEFLHWWPAVQKVTGDATYNAIFFKPSAQYTITWKDWDGKLLATSIVDERDIPKYPGASKPSRSGYIFTGWTPEIDLATADQTYTATYEKKSSGGGGGGGSGSGGGGGGGSGSGGGGSSAVIAYAEKPAVTPITVAANGAQMMGTAVVSIPTAQLVKNGLAPVTGIWSKTNGMWAFTKADGNKAKNEWALITVAGGNASYFYFDSNGNMVTGWQRVGGKWMYFNNESGSLLGASLRGPGRTPDGYEIDATGAWTGR